MRKTTIDIWKQSSKTSIKTKSKINKGDKMGADGGITIHKIKDIKNGWPEIRIEIINFYEKIKEKECNRSEWHCKNHKKRLNAILNSPSNIDDLDNEELGKLLYSIIPYYDTPYVIDFIVITAYGTNIDEDAEALFDMLPSCEQIETWS